MRCKTQKAKHRPADWEEQGRIFALRLAYLVDYYGLSPEDVWNEDQVGVGSRLGGNKEGGRKQHRLQ